MPLNIIGFRWRELHCFPVRVNGQILPDLPSPLIRSGISALWWAHWAMTKRAEDGQRRRLGLPGATGTSTRRIIERGSLEIQAYDELFFPGLAAEWTRWNAQRPFVGALRMTMPTDADDEISVVVRRRDTADLFRLRQHAGRIVRRDRGNDQRGVRRIG